MAGDKRLSSRYTAATDKPTAPADDKATTSTDKPASTSLATRAHGLKQSAREAIEKATASQHAQAGAKFLSAYTKTWVGMSPLWLMGEAIIPGQKVGGQFKSGATELVAAAEDLRKTLSLAASDVLVIIDSQLKSGKEESAKTAELLKAAGGNAVVVVSTSLDKAGDQIKVAGPEIQRALKTHGKDAILVVDKTLKHPLVITGVTRFARSQGVPHPEAILTVASLALNKIADAIDLIPEPAGAIDAGDRITEIDAGELRRTSSQAAEEESKKVGKLGEGPVPKVEQGDRSGVPPPAVPVEGAEPSKKGKKDGGCVIA